MTRTRGAVSPSDESARTPLGNYEAAIKDMKHLHGFEKIRKWDNEERERRFHHLVRRYISQLVYGCQEPLCKTPTCLSYQRRVTDAPLRRMTPLSARAVATFLASQDDPERGLCSNKPVVAITFDQRQDEMQRRNTISNGDIKSSHANAEGIARHSRSRSTASSAHGRTRHKTSEHGEGKSEVSTTSIPEDRETSRHACSETLSTKKGAKGKDPQSFTQNLFDTLAMRMLEWVPLRSSNERDSRTPSIGEPPAAGLLKPKSKKPTKMHNVPGDETEESFSQGQPPRRRADSQEQSEPHNKNSYFSVVEQPSSTKAGLPLRSVVNDEPSHRGIRDLSSRCNAARKTSLVTPSHTHRPTSPPSSPPALKNRREKHGPPVNGDMTSTKPKPRRKVSWDGSKLLRDVYHSSFRGGGREKSAQLASGTSDTDLPGPAEEPEQEDDESPRINLQSTCSESPQTLTYFDRSITTELVNRIHDAINEDEKTRKRWQASRVFPHLTPYCHEASTLKKLFDLLEQSIFYVFGFPDPLLISFRENAFPGCKLYLPDTDISSLCSAIKMFRELNLSTNLFHSVWRGLEDLFVPPPGLRRSRRPKKSTSQKQRKAMTDASNTSASRVEKAYIDDADAAHIFIVAFCALAVMLPDMSRQEWSSLCNARAKGCALPDGPQSERALEAHDVFEDEMALRLLYRLVRAISTRVTCFEILKLQSKNDDMVEGFENLGMKDNHVLFRILAKLINDLGGGELGKITPVDLPVHESFTSYASHYSGNRKLSPQPMAWRLVEWLRSALLKEWNGTPVATRGSIFGSAVLVLNSFHKDRCSLDLSAEVFHTPRLSQRLDPMRMPSEWLARSPNNDEVHLLDYSFLFHPSDVVVYFRSINYAIMTNAYESTIVMERFVYNMKKNIPQNENLGFDLKKRLGVATRPFLVLQVSRENPLEDTLNQLWKREKREMLRPLKVRIGREINEEGVDQGGVQQELFRLILAEILNPRYGMFTYDEGTRMSWFQPCSFETESKFEMIGLLFSLAIYNGLTLPITFPIAFYLKILGFRAESFEDIDDGWPELSRGLSQLGRWRDGDVGDVFMRTYDFSFDAFGTPVNVDMTKFGPEDPWPPRQTFKAKAKAKVDLSVHGLTNLEALQIQDYATASAPTPPPEYEDGSTNVLSTDSDAPLVTNANRMNYILDYIYWLTTKSISREFNAFLRGFFVCIDRKALSMFTPEALKAVVEGSQVVDVDALQSATKYDDQNFGPFGAERSYTKDSLPVIWFWEVVREWDMAKKRKLLEFVTASDRVPVTGTGTITFSIIRNGSGDTYLPTCHTCFGRLSLPEYSSKEILKERLETAIEHVWGFGVA